MNSDLKSRIPVAIIYVLTIVIMLWLGNPYDVVLLVLLFLASLHEFQQISGTNERTLKNRLSLFIPGIVIMTLAIVSPFLPIVWHVLVALSVAYFITNGFYLIWTSKVLFRSNRVWLDGLMYLSLPFALVTWQSVESGNFHLFLLAIFVMIWLNDTGAYFVGSTIGRTKLHKKISPGKTWEGLIGGVVVALSMAVLIFNITDIWSYLIWITLAIVVVTASIVGDLSESAWKRSYSIKDTSSTLKGHGGFLDRLDSFIYTAPFAVLAWELIIWFSKY